MKLFEQTKIFDGTFVDDHTFLDADGNIIELKTSVFDEPSDNPPSDNPPSDNPPPEDNPPFDNPPRKRPPDNSSQKRPPKQSKQLPDKDKTYLDVFSNTAYKWDDSEGRFVKTELTAEMKKLMDDVMDNVL